MDQTWCLVLPELQAGFVAFQDPEASHRRYAGWTCCQDPGHVATTTVPARVLLVLSIRFSFCRPFFMTRGGQECGDVITAEVKINQEPMCKSVEPPPPLYLLKKQNNRKTILDTRYKEGYLCHVINGKLSRNKYLLWQTNWAEKAKL